MVARRHTNGLVCSLAKTSGPDGDARRAPLARLCRRDGSLLAKGDTLSVSVSTDSKALPVPLDGRRLWQHRS